MARCPLGSGPTLTLGTTDADAGVAATAMAKSKRQGRVVGCMAARVTLQLGVAERGRVDLLGFKAT